MEGYHTYVGYPSRCKKKHYSKIISPLFFPNILRFSEFMISFMASCAFTEFPDSSSGGANAAIPNTPGRIPITPPPTPVFAGIPDV